MRGAFFGLGALVGLDYGARKGIEIIAPWAERHRVPVKETRGDTGSWRGWSLSGTTAEWKPRSGNTPLMDSQLDSRSGLRIIGLGRDLGCALPTSCGDQSAVLFLQSCSIIAL